jgi:hypothetical protein
MGVAVEIVVVLELMRVIRLHEDCFAIRTT